METILSQDNQSVAEELLEQVRERALSDIALLKKLYKTTLSNSDNLAITMFANQQERRKEREEQAQKNIEEGEERARQAEERARQRQEEAERQRQAGN